MNLHGIVSGAIGAVNPFVPVALEASTGYTTQPGGKRVPSYAAPVTVMAQVQALSYNDITQLDGLNIQGVRNAMYISGVVNGIVRPDSKGGDLITMPDGTVWLVAIVLENWPDFTKVAVTLQAGT